MTIKDITHILVLPLYFVLFMSVFEPDGIVEYMSGGDISAAETRIILEGCIIAGAVLLSRIGIAIYRRKWEMTGRMELFWFCFEMLLLSAFAGMYLSLISHDNFFTTFIRVFLICFAILTPPYIIINQSFALKEAKKAGRTETAEDSNIRFYDEHHKLRLIISSKAVIFIKADDNVLRINYLDSEKIKEYTLRASMKSIEQTVTDKGLVRCQRSYFVNPAFVKVLRKDSAGFLFADLSIEGARPVPISRTYYDNLASIL